MGTHSSPSRLRACEFAEIICEQHGWTLPEAIMGDQRVYRCFCAREDCMGYAMTSSATARRNVKAGRPIVDGVDFRIVLWP